MTTSSDGILTATTDPATASVKLTVAFSGYVAAYNRVTVTRADGTVVRGLDSAVAPGGMTKGYDHEAAIGVAQIYTAYLINGVVTVASTTATATIADDGTAWLKSLTSPSLSAPLTVEQYPDTEYAIPESLLAIQGSPYPLAQLGRRQAGSGTLRAVTATATAAAALAALLDTTGPYLLQGSAASGESDRYVVVGAVTVARVSRIAAETYRRWDLPLIEVARPPTVGSTVTIPGKTYGDSTAALPWYFYLTGTYGSQS